MTWRSLGFVIGQAVEILKRCRVFQQMRGMEKIKIFYLLSVDILLLV